MSETLGGRTNVIQNSDTSITILLADDSEVVRRSIRQILSADSKVELVGEAADFAQTIQMASDLKPQVVILDLHMPDEASVIPNDFKSHLNQGSQLLAISIWNDADNKTLAESFGAAALLDKMNLGSALIPAILRLHQKNTAAA